MAQPNLPETETQPEETKKSGMGVGTWILGAVTAGLAGLVARAKLASNRFVRGAENNPEFKTFLEDTGNKIINSSSFSEIGEIRKAASKVMAEKFSDIKNSTSKEKAIIGAVAVGAGAAALGFAHMVRQSRNQSAEPTEELTQAQRIENQRIANEGAAASQSRF